MKRVLIVAPNWLGDSVMALPALADVRRTLPDAHVTVAAHGSVAALLSIVESVNEVVALDDATAAYEAALLLPNSFRSALAVMRARIPERWGFRTDWRGMLLTRAIDRPAGVVHQVDSYQHLVRELGFVNGSPVPQLSVPRSLVDAAGQALRAAGWNGESPLVALAPGAAFGPSKLWPAHAFGELAAGLASDGVTGVLVGAAADQKVAEQVMGDAVEARLPRGESLLNLVGKTNVPVLAGVLAQCRAAVGNDSGAIHLAAAVGIRTTVLFGPTNERLTAPRGMQDSVVLTNPVWCRPCMLRDCPLDHACLRGIPVAAALRATQAR